MCLDYWIPSSSITVEMNCSCACACVIISIISRDENNTNATRRFEDLQRLEELTACLESLRARSPPACGSLRLHSATCVMARGANTCLSGCVWWLHHLGRPPETNRPQPQRQGRPARGA